MLGAAMDGHGSESDRFVACGPKLIGDIEQAGHYLLHGVCYWVTDTNSVQPTNVRKIAPLRQRDLQIFKMDDLNHYYFMYGESGFSVHVTDNNEEIIIGAPGVFNWKGSVIRYKSVERQDLGGLSRRSIPSSKTIRKRQVSKVYEYRSEIPNPYYSDLSDDSYFGFAVSSGSFLGSDDPKIYYVASAPQANLQTGLVLLFDIVEHTITKRIRTYNKFIGTQMGEYFGYALLTEDFNGDNLPDIAIAAPFYSKTGTRENGALYVYINIGNLAFERQEIITTDYELDGRFGIALSKIGDVNFDGYNDIAVSAPFEDDGVVYIFHGSANGLSTKPSQKLKAPQVDIHKYGSAMFGHGISRGVDIDNNGFPDIAIGAPNSEMVYVYRSYPVVKVVSRITTTKNELSMEDTAFQINVCTHFESPTNIKKDSEIYMQLAVDMQHNRASFSNSEHKKVMNNTIKINNHPHCWEYDVFVKSSLAEIFKPIIIEVKFDLVKKIPEEGSEFCEDCVILDPKGSKVVTHKIPFITGCEGETCMSDLMLKGTPDFKQPYVIGSSRILAIHYEIYNFGETAYLTQISVQIPTNITQFAKVPSNCVQKDDKMDCDIDGGRPLYKNHKSSIVIHLDSSRLEGTEFTVIASVSSAGNETNPQNNVAENTIYLTEFSEIEVLGHSSKTSLSIQDGLRIENVTYNFEIRNNGPSSVKELIVGIMIPISYILEPRFEVKIVNVEDMAIRGTYTNKALDITLMKDNKILVQGQEASTPRILDNMNSNDFDSSKLGFDYDINAPKDGDAININPISQHRRRRSFFDDSNIEDSIFRKFNAYTNSLEEYEASVRTLPNQNDQVLRNLPGNRTIFLNCLDPIANECVEAQFTVYNFKPGNTPIQVTVDFSMDLRRVDRLFSDKQNIFLFQTRTKLVRGGDEEMKTIRVTAKNPYTLVYEQILSEAPILVIVISAITGFLMLVILSYAMYRVRLTISINLYLDF